MIYTLYENSVKSLFICIWCRIAVLTNDSGGSSFDGFSFYPVFFIFMAFRREQNETVKTPSELRSRITSHPVKNPKRGVFGYAL